MRYFDGLFSYLLTFYLNILQCAILICNPAWLCVHQYACTYINMVVLYINIDNIVNFLGLYQLQGEYDKLQVHATEHDQYVS